MTNETFLQQLRDGTLPPVGILSMSGATDALTLTTTVDGETVPVPVVSLPEPELEEAA